jgi:purine nucleosidase
MPRLLLDVDTGIDDALALLYLAAQDCEIVAAGSVHGNVPAPTAAANTLRVLERAGLGHVPVAVGAAYPLAQPLSTAEFVHGQDGLGGCAGPPAAAAPSAGSAAEQLVAYARAHPGELTVLATGPLTNLAVATLLEPQLPQLLARVVVMAGAMEVAGNATAAADGNCWHDPEAADLVFGAGYALQLVPLDVTRGMGVDLAWLDRLAAVDTDRAQWAASLLEHYVRVYLNAGETTATLHDPLAAAIALDPSLARWRPQQVQVELRGQHTRGRTVIDQRPHRIGSTFDARPPIEVAVEATCPPVLEAMLAALGES